MIKAFIQRYKQRRDYQSELLNDVMPDDTALFGGWLFIKSWLQWQITKIKCLWNAIKRE